MITATRIIATILLVAYAMTGTSVMPAMISMAAWIDGSHSVLVAESEQGTQLILHHRSHCYTPRLADHDHTLTKILVSMCTASDSGDHQMKSVHVTETANLHDAVKRTVQSMPTLNLQETNLLTLSIFWIAGETTLTLSGGAVVRRGLYSRPVLAFVQMLI